MKRFLLKSSILIVTCFALFVLLTDFLITNYPKTSSKLFFKHDWLRINERIHTSKNEITQDTIYVGCSVAGQILPYNNGNQLTSNGSTYPIGNYFLIKNAIERNNNINCVIYYSVPDVIGRRMSMERTYNYFVKPFYTKENKEEIMSSEKVKKVLTKNKFLDLNLINSYKMLPIGDFNYNNGGEQFSFSLSDVALEWLIKIDSLCRTKNVEFVLASPPVPKSKKEKSKNWTDIREKVKDTPIERLFTNYFKSIIYVDDKFLKDNVHWQHDFIQRNKKAYLMIMKNRLQQPNIPNQVVTVP